MDGSAWRRQQRAGTALHCPLLPDVHRCWGDPGNGGRHAAHSARGSAVSGGALLHAPSAPGVQGKHGACGQVATKPRKD
eukprot:8016097-Alexandrium_andersonii.AAC.1